MLGNIYEAKPRYELLDELLEDYLINLKFTNIVNVIIDLKQVYRKIFRSSYSLETSENSVLAVEAQRISSDILNIIAHYRNYFYKKGKYTNFYFVYSTKECEILKQLNPNYKKDFYSKYLHSEKDANKITMLKKVNHGLSVLLKEFPNCLFIESSKFDELLYMKYLTNTKPKNELNVILTNDENIYQLVSPNTVCLNISGIDTKLVDSKSLYKILDIDTKISYRLYNLVLSISGNKKYSIGGIKGYSFKKASQLVSKLVEEKKIQNTLYNTFPIILETLNPNDKQENELIKNYELIESNFNIFTLNNLYNENLITLQSECLIPKKIYCKSVFEKINDKVFTNYPLDLPKILRGEL